MEQTKFSPVTRRHPFRFHFRWLGDLHSRSSAHRLKLAMQRPMTSLLEREILALSDDIVEERENWVKALVDHGHAFECRRTRITAFRALNTNNGVLFWLVRKKGKVYRYHSNASSPSDAIIEAKTAWHGRRQIRKKWARIERLMWDLLIGRKKLRVRIEDAHRSPLCGMGIDAFMERMRLSHVREISGRMAALLMWIDPQVGFVLDEANRRARREAEPENGRARIAAP